MEIKSKSIMPDPLPAAPGAKKLPYVNLGCGAHFHPDWINIDIVAMGPGVIAHDLSKGIPLADQSCEVVYHSHVLEHLRRADVNPFLKECFRVLKPGGILRVAVPDLEQICALYLEKLNGALRGDKAAAADYEWIMLEMYDQTVREHWKSPMWDYLNGGKIPNAAFVSERIGKMNAAPPATAPAAPRPLRAFLKGVLERLDWIKPIRAWKIGRFRLRGEIHQWMYDRYSLGQALLAAGFAEPAQQTATGSRIADWEKFHLDTFPDGAIYKPDSLFMEAVKPR
jgi:predicted SAM-dependent methyltransferase